MTDEEKNRYTAFLNEVCELLGLNKPIDVLRLCQITDDYLAPFQKRIQELETELDKVKCCAFCKHMIHNQMYQPVCILESQQVETRIENPYYCKCDKWECGRE